MDPFGRSRLKLRSITRQQLAHGAQAVSLVNWGDVVVSPWDKSMTETEFLDQVATVWQQVEQRVDLWAEGQDLGVEACRVGPVLEIEFDSGRKIVINPQTPMQQIWLASPHGAFHFRFQEGHWVDTRTAQSFWDVLSGQAALVSGQTIR